MKKAIFLGMLSLLSWYGCKEEGRIDIINEDAPAPLPLTEVTVTPRHGGAVLRYQIPNDENLLCVKAVYERLIRGSSTKPKLLFIWTHWC